MTMDIQAFEWAQGILRGLLIRLHGRVPRPSLEQIAELVDAAELPLALEILLQSLEHNGVKLADEEIEQVSTLATRLQVPFSF
jgi:hypothetical protein